MNEDGVIYFRNGSELKIFKKPPLGIIPQHIWKENRGHDLIKAIVRYSEYGGIKYIPTEWIEELLKLNIEAKKDQTIKQECDKPSIEGVFIGGINE